ncbi:MAG TPA: caspase family protein [Steroidobacteraceae bacterium]|nr:caspase family protein [Steroidobacteraceae bacterium]
MDRTIKNVLALALSFFLLGVCGTASATEARRAVVIGIDKYALPGGQAVPRGDPPSPLRWLNLKGAVNDANRTRDLLVARYGFARSDIVMLTDAQATRAAILQAIDRQLIAPAKSGDLVFFYFAGHGSRVRNSLSHESDKLDESIVPADAASGTRDIRDKELRDAFNKVLDKGATLVAIFDSCHSGSITRGLAGDPPFDARLLPIDTRDVKDGTVAASPWERGALILSAAQSDQVASEDSDEFGHAGGRFSIALAKVLRTVPTSEPAQQTFRRILGVMHSRGVNQDAVLEATAARKEQPLFGGVASGGGQGRLSAAVESVNGNTVTLQEGLGAGLTVNSELSRVADPGTQLRVERLDGISRSFASVQAGRRESIGVGDLFVVDRAAPSDIPSLHVWVPESPLDAAALKRLHDSLRDAVTSGGSKWVTDPVTQPPTHVVLYVDGQWWLRPPTGTPISLGQQPPAAAALTSHLTPASAPRVYLMLPAPRQFSTSIQIGAGTSNSAIDRASAARADYYLMGTIKDGRLTYAWIRPWQGAPQVSALPMRTDWVDANSAQAASDLAALAVKLGFVNAWLTLEGAPGAKPFPYSLALRNTVSGNYLYEGVTREGEAYELALVRNNASLQQWRYVYVYSIDAWGNMALLFPRPGGVENRYPPEHDQTPQDSYVLDPSIFDVGAPFGTDTYLLLTSSEQFSNPSMLEASGVRTRSAAAGDKPIFQMLSDVGARTRAPQPRPVPSEWSIDRITVVSRPRGAQ